MAQHYNPRIVTEDLVLCLDAASQASLTQIGTTWSDLSDNNNNGTLSSSSQTVTNRGFTLQYQINNTTEDAMIISGNSSTDLTNGEILMIDSEQVKVGAFTNYFGSYPRFEITRGHNSTTAAAHSAGVALKKVADYISFDGNSQITDVGDIGNVFGTSFTIDLWIYPTEIDDRQEFIGQKQNSNYWWRFGIDELDNWEIDVQDNGSRTVSLNPDFSLVINQWQHVVLSRDSSNWNFYLNGALDVTASDSDTIPDMAASVKLGRPVDSAYEGRMAVVRIYDRYLSAAEISKNFNAQRGRFGV